jgi:hypothetical protein
VTSQKIAEDKQVNLIQSLSTTIDERDQTKVSLPDNVLQQHVLNAQASMESSQFVSEEFKSPQSMDEARMVLKTSQLGQEARNLSDQIEKTKHEFVRYDSTETKEYTQKDVNLIQQSSNLPEFTQETADLAATLQKLVKSVGQAECDYLLKEDNIISNVLNTKSSTDDLTQQSVYLQKPDLNEMVDLMTSVYITDAAQLDSAEAGDESLWLDSSLNWSIDSQEANRLLNVANEEKLKSTVAESKVENVGLIQQKTFFESDMDAKTFLSEKQFDSKSVKTKAPSHETLQTDVNLPNKSEEKLVEISSKIPQISSSERAFSIERQDVSPDLKREASDKSIESIQKDKRVERSFEQLNEYGSEETSTLATIERVPKKSDKQESGTKIESKQHLFDVLNLSASSDEGLTKEMVLQKLLQPEAVTEVAKRIAHSDFAHFSTQAASDIAELFQTSITSIQQSEEIGHLIKTGNYDSAERRVRELIESASNISHHYDLVDQESLVQILLAEIAHDSNLLNANATSNLKIDIQAELQNALEKEGASVQKPLEMRERTSVIFSDALTKTEASFHHVSDQGSVQETRADLNLAQPITSKVREFEKEETVISSELHRVPRPTVIGESQMKVSTETKIEDRLNTKASTNIISDSNIQIDSGVKEETKSALITERIRSEESLKTEESKYDALGIGRNFYTEAQQLQFDTTLPTDTKTSVAEKFKEFGETVSTLQAQLDVVNAEASSETLFKDSETTTNLLNTQASQKAEAFIQQQETRLIPLESTEETRKAVVSDSAQQSFKISQETVSPSLMSERISESVSQTVDESRLLSIQPETYKEYGKEQIDSSAQLVRTPVRQDEIVETSRESPKPVQKISEIFSGKVPTKQIEEVYETQQVREESRSQYIPPAVLKQAEQDKVKSFEAIYSTFDAEIESDATLKETVRDQVFLTTKQSTDLHTATFNTILPIPASESAEVVRPFSQITEEQRKFIIEVSELRRQFAQGIQTENIQQHLAKINEIQGPQVSFVEVGNEENDVEILLVRQPLQKRSLKTEHLVGINSQLVQVLNSRSTSDVHTESSCEWRGPEAVSETSLSIKTKRSAGPESFITKSSVEEKMAFSSNLMKSTASASDRHIILQGPLERAVSEKLHEMGEGLF